MELGIKVKLYLWCHAGSYLNLGVNSLIIYILQNIFLFKRKKGKNTEKKKDSEREAMGEGRREEEAAGRKKGSTYFRSEVARCTEPLSVSRRLKSCFQNTCF